MLVRLLPEQILKQWDILAPTLEATLPPVERTRMAAVLKSLLSGRLVMWLALTTPNGKDSEVAAMVVTSLVQSACGEGCDLLIYALYGWDRIEPEMWTGGLSTLQQYARGLKCDRIIAFTNVERVKQVVNQLGGDTSWSLLTFPLEV